MNQAPQYDAPIERIRQNLVGLRMPRALEILDAVVQQIERGSITSIEAIDSLLAEEFTVREGRRIKAALQMARLSTIKTLTGFDFSFQPSLDRNRIMALAGLDFIGRHEVVHLIGQSGTGKSHLAIALGVEAVRAGRSVYFSPLADIIDSLAKADREGRLRERIRYLCRAQLLIIDEIGYLSLAATAGNLFFQLVNARYERGAMILTSNRGFAEWGQVFGDPVIATALLDRLLHHAVVVHIEGSSYRMRQHADLLPQAQRPSAVPADAPPRPSAKGHNPSHRQRLSRRRLSPDVPCIALHNGKQACPKVGSPKASTRSAMPSDKPVIAPGSKPRPLRRSCAIAAQPTAAPGHNAGPTPSLSCWPCRPSMLHGPTPSRKPYAIPLPPKRSRLSSTSTWPNSPTSNRRAAMGETEP